jgi:hypothetical protein
MLEPIVHESIKQRAGALIAQHTRSRVEWQIGRDDRRVAVAALKDALVGGDAARPCDVRPVPLLPRTMILSRIAGYRSAPVQG